MSREGNVARRDAAIRIVRPGLHTTVQDAGRWGWQAMGVSVSGPMDRLSYRLANAVVSNPPGFAALEIAFTGPEVEFEDARTVAVAGADFDVTVNGQAVPMHAAIPVPAGGCLRFGAKRSGARAYLAIAGGIDVPPVLGSRSTHVTSRLGGFEGRALAAGDRLPLGAALEKSSKSSKPADSLPRLPTHANPASRDRVLRILPGRHLSRFVDGALGVLQSPYIVGTQSNRMGLRLEGEQIRHRDTADIQSEITPMGSVQVPASGHPILLMADRQTMGGYTVIANVISADLPVAGQLSPGDSVQFRHCTAEEAQSALAAQERAIAAFERGVAS